MIQKIRKKSDVANFEAIRFDNLNRDEVIQFIGQKVTTELESDAAWQVGKHPPVFSITFESKVGNRQAFSGDWIIKETYPDGEIYFNVCKNDLFKRLFETDITSDFVELLKLLRDNEKGKNVYDITDNKETQRILNEMIEKYK
jgi:hypothetical protein